MSSPQSGDVADETGGSGIDLVRSALTFSLANAARAKGSIENLTLTGAGEINATGNGLANLLVGNAGINVINGAAGNDTHDRRRPTPTPSSSTRRSNKATNVDHITDFAKGTDTLLLDASVFQKLKVGDLKKKAFFAKDGAEKAKDKFDRIIYDTRLRRGPLRQGRQGQDQGRARRRPRRQPRPRPFRRAGGRLRLDQPSVPTRSRLASSGRWHLPVHPAHAFSPCVLGSRRSGGPGAGFSLRRPKRSRESRTLNG